MISHYCYILRNMDDNTKTYNGYTVNPTKRIRQHNQEIKGGAKYTAKWGNKSWQIYVIIKGFPDIHNAMQCEWRIKHPTNKKIRPPKFNTPEGRIKALNDILKYTKWTNNTTINISDLNLELWILSIYSHLLSDIPNNIKINIVDNIDLTKL
jgi:predicted GIY-YIG superfamily endonuclease